MMKRYGILGQAAPAAGVVSGVYSGPVGRHATVRVLICNRGSADTFRIAVSPNGAPLENKHYVAYDQSIDANDSVSSVAFTVTEYDQVLVRSAGGSVSFTVTGIEDDN